MKKPAAQPQHSEPCGDLGMTAKQAEWEAGYKQPPATNLLELAWGIIANAGGGDWERESKDWQDAAAKWRDTYHGSLSPTTELDLKTQEMAGLPPQPPATDLQAEGSPWREWTPEYVGSLVGETFNGAWKIAEAHNAALAAAYREGVQTGWPKDFEQQLAVEWEKSGNLNTEMEQQLAAEQENYRLLKEDAAKGFQKRISAELERDDLRQQLLAAQAAIANIKAIARKFSGNKEIGNYFWELKQEIEAINVDPSALEQHDAEVREKNNLEWGRRIGEKDSEIKALHAERKPLVDALRKMPEVAYESLIEGTGVTPENLPNELQCIADDALARQGGSTTAYLLPDGRTK